MKFRHIASFTLVAGLALSLSSCSGCSRTSNAGTGQGSDTRVQSSSQGVPASFYTPPGAVYDVTYTPNTIRIDLPTTKKLLRSVSEDGRMFVFEGSDSRLAALAAGKVIFLEHLGARRVLAVQQQGSQTAILTDPAALTDFIQNGRIQFSAPVNFWRDRAQASPTAAAHGVLANLRAWFGPPQIVYAGEENETSIGLTTSGKIDDWEFELEGKPEGDGFKLELEAKKNLAGITASVKTEGEISHISTAFKADIHDGAMQDMEYSTPLGGNLHVAWAALTSGENSGIGEARLKLPPFAKDVFDIYGLPMLFRIDEALIFKPGFGTKHDAAEGEFDINYDGTGGLSVNGEQSNPEGSMQADPELGKTTSESMAAHGIVLAVDAPKVSVSVGTEAILEALKEAVPQALEDKVAQVLEDGPFGSLLHKTKEDFFKLEGAAYVQLVTEFDYTGSGPLSLVPCTMTHFNFYAQAGADAQVGFLKGESPHVDLYKTEKVVRDPDSDICGKK